MRFKAEQMIDRKLFFSVAIVMVTQLVTTATPFPSDLQPISVVGLEDSQLYWTFQGVALENDTSRLGLDFQRMIRIQELLYIAARDHVFVLNLTTTHHTITPQQVLTWRSADVSKCTMRGRNSDECYNYIKVLVPRNPDTLFVCGTNAFNPACRNYRSSSLEQVGQELLGQARCPFESSQSNVALFAGGHFYSATVTDFQASDAVIYRSLGGEGRPVLRTLKYDSKWLREPHFLHAVEYGNYVYFFFSEIAVEHMAGGKVVYSRVARVCKNDSGGSPRVLDRYWTSFLKARLNCSVSGETFFFFDILQSVTNVLQINQRPAVIAVFTTQTNSIPGSAVCGFYLDEMERVFNGRFKEQKNSDSVWSSVSEETVPTPRPGSCAGEGSASSFSSSVQFPDSVLIFIKTHPLMDESVPAVNNQPLMTSTTSRYKLTGIAVDPAAGPHQNRTVVFLGSEDGRVLKVLISSQAGAAHSKLLEELSVHDPARCAGGAEVVSLELDKEHHSLLVAFSSCVVRVPLSRCARHATCKRRCLLTHDPYCIWLRTGRCADIAPGFKAGFEQDIDGDGSESHDLCSDVMSSSEDDGTSREEDSASGVERSAAVLRWADVSHAWVLCVCVLLAFVCGGVVSVSLLWCYCAGRSRRARDTEASLPPALSLDSLAKLNRLLDARADKSDVTSLQIYSAGPPRRQPPLPPDSATELPIKTPRTLHSQWERSHTHLDSEVRLTQQVFPVPPDEERRDLTVMTSSSLLPGSRGWGAHDCRPPPRPLGVTGSRQHFYQRSSRGHLITGSALTRQHSYSQPPLTQHAAIRRTTSMRPHPHADILKEF